MLELITSAFESVYGFLYWMFTEARGSIILGIAFFWLIDILGKKRKRKKNK